MIRSFLTRAAIVAAAIVCLTSTSFAAVDMFLEIKDAKGKVVSRCEVSSNGSFDCPALPKGEYTASLSWSWGVSNQGASSQSGQSSGRRGVVTTNAGGTTTVCPDKITFTYNVKSPRDAASGQATGKRQHKPMVLTTIIDNSSPSTKKELDKSTPKLALGSFTIDDDCDGISGKVKGSGHKGEIEILSWSWGETNR